MTKAGASVVVIGGGVTGLSAAWWLARSGVDVTVVEKGIVGFEASGRNGGGCTHYQSPLFHEEQRLWPQMDDLLGYPTEYRRGRIIFQVDERKAKFHEELAMRLPHGYAFDVLDGREVRAMVPLAGDNAISGVRLHFGGHANPQRTVQAYAWAAQDHGARVVQHVAVRGFETAGGRVTALETSVGRIGCDALVIAAGPQTGALVAMLGLDLPMAPARAPTSGSPTWTWRPHRRGPREASCAASPSASPSFCRERPMRASSEAGRALSRTRPTAGRCWSVSRRPTT